MRKVILLAATALALIAGPALAKKQLVIVVKGLDNPFFEQINLGCKKWLSENPDSEYECLYTGPASSADEAGEVQIVERDGHGVVSWDEPQALLGSQAVTRRYAAPGVARPFDDDVHPVGSARGHERGRDAAQGP